MDVVIAVAVSTENVFELRVCLASLSESTSDYDGRVEFVFVQSAARQEVSLLLEQYGETVSVGRRLAHGTAKTLSLELAIAKLEQEGRLERAVVITVDPDMIYRRGWLQRMVSQMSQWSKMSGWIAGRASNWYCLASIRPARLGTFDESRRSPPQIVGLPPSTLSWAGMDSERLRHSYFVIPPVIYEQAVLWNPAVCSWYPLSFEHMSRGRGGFVARSMLPVELPEGLFDQLGREFGVAGSVCRTHVFTDVATVLTARLLYQLHPQGFQLVPLDKSVFQPLCSSPYNALATHLGRGSHFLESDWHKSGQTTRWVFTRCAFLESAARKLQVPGLEDWQVQCETVHAGIWLDPKYQSVLEKVKEVQA